MGALEPVTKGLVAAYTAVLTGAIRGDSRASVEAALVGVAVTGAYDTLRALLGRNTAADVEALDTACRWIEDSAEGGVRDFLARIRPTSLDDLVSAVAGLSTDLDGTMLEQSIHATLRGYAGDIYDVDTCASAAELFHKALLLALHDHPRRAERARVALQELNHRKMLRALGGVDVGATRSASGRSPTRLPWPKSAYRDQDALATAVLEDLEQSAPWWIETQVRLCAYVGER